MGLVVSIKASNVRKMVYHVTLYIKPGGFFRLSFPFTHHIINFFLQHRLCGWQKLVGETWSCSGRGSWRATWNFHPSFYLSGNMIWL